MVDEQAILQKGLGSLCAETVVVKWRNPTDEFRGAAEIVRRFIASDKEMHRCDILVAVPNAFWASGVAEALQALRIRSTELVVGPPREGAPARLFEDNRHLVRVGDYWRAGEQGLSPRLVVACGLCEGVMPASFLPAEGQQAAFLQTARSARERLVLSYCQGIGEQEAARMRIPVARKRRVMGRTVAALACSPYVALASGGVSAASGEQLLGDWAG